jgi:hypothetical protein
MSGFRDALSSAKIGVVYLGTGIFWDRDPLSGIYAASGNAAERATVLSQEHGRDHLHLISLGGWNDVIHLSIYLSIQTVAV